MEEISKYAVANCFNLARKAKKKVIKTENKTKGLFLFHRLVAGELSNLVRDDFKKMRGFLEDIKKTNVLRKESDAGPSATKD